MNDIASVKKAFSDGKISETELFDLCMKRAEGSDSNAYITRCAYRKEKDGILSGVPFAVKDNFTTKDVLTTCASEMLSEYVPFFDAYVVERLKKAGAVMTGKTNMDEFAIGSTGETSFYGATKNPIDKTRVGGGSSSGSAAAVAEGSAVFALGSDTGGSVRLPAAYCSLVGLAPTYSLVSRYGLIPYASSLDRVGIISRTVSDAAIVLDEISEIDNRDMSNAKTKYTFSEDKIKRGVRKRKIAVAEELFSHCDKKTARNAEQTLEKLSRLGAERVSVSLHFVKEALCAYRIISAIEASSNLLRYDGVRYGKRAAGNGFNEIAEKTRSTYFGSEVKKKILSGCFFASAYGEKYKNGAYAVRKMLTDELEGILHDADALILPSAKTLPPMLNAKSDDDTDEFMVLSGLSGHPSVTVPSGNMTGIQIMGRYFAENDILSVAYALEGTQHGD